MNINLNQTDSKRVMFAGDIHGNEKHAKYVFEQAKKEGATHIIACGDFGYWAHTVWGKKYLNLVAKLAETNNIEFLWVDGNHENHDMLHDLVAKHGDSEPIPTPNKWVRYIPRGCRFTIGTTKFMGYGGAYSVDWQQRVEGQSWWRGELINPYHVDQLSDEPVDVLVTHEAPYGKEISYKDEIPVSVNQRILVSEIMHKVQPSMVVTGHHHTRQTWYDGETQINVLGRDTMGEESVLVLDV